MNRLVKIEILKIRTNASFWVLAVLHIAIILLVILSGKMFLRSLSIQGETISNLIDPGAIPLYQFPDIWHNITYVAAFLKFILAIYVIISITSEISYDTLRQNIMNGLSRKDFIVSKLFLVVLLALASTLFLFFTGLIIGFTSTPDPRLHDVIKYSGFIPAYFLLLTVYLVFALLIGLLIRKTGLALGLMFLYTLIIEPIIAFRIHTEWIKGLLPIKSINNLIHMPFVKYALREVKDYVAPLDMVIVSVYAALFIWFIYLLLKKRDL
ncbi:MAG TPA: ABC transporter permease subunit [Bacteroidales bacterium]|nr:ABC transporter permease subunit [Bacteroidales bacterium]